MNNIILYFRKFFYWLLPIIILAYVFSKVEINQLINILKTGDIYLILTGMLFIQISVCIGAVRWYFLFDKKFTFFYLLKHYWIGLSLGIFMPASIGWDAYRITITGRKNGEYTRKISLLIWEKIIALLNVLLILLIVYPFLTLTHHQDVLDEIYHLVLTGIISFIVILFLFRKNLLRKTLSVITKKLRSIVYGILNKLPEHAIKNINVIETFKNSISWKLFFSTFIFSLFIQISSSISTQIFFQSVGYDIPFLSNFFATPLFFLIFILPISFGGLGIREATYIIIFNLFGVPLEIALLVSFLGLFTILLNLLIGGFILWLNRTNRE